MNALKSLRTKEDLSQSEFAGQLGVDRSAIAKWGIGCGISKGGITSEDCIDFELYHRRFISGGLSMKITLEGSPFELLAVLTPEQLRKLLGIGKPAIDTTGLTVRVEKDTEAIL